MHFADKSLLNTPGSPPSHRRTHCGGERDDCAFAEEQLGHVLPEKLALVLAMHLTSTLEHLAQGRQIAGLAIQSVRRHVSNRI